VHVAANTPQAAMGLFAICPGVAKLLAVVALGERIWGFVGLSFYDDMAKGRQLESFLRLCRPGKGDKE
jgi:hypothetical protein